MPVLLHDPDLIDNKLLSAPFAERHLLQGHLEWDWRPWAGEALLQESMMTMERAFLEWWGWAVPTALWPCGHTPELRKWQDYSWFLHLLGCHLPEIFCLLNSGKMSLNCHPQISDKTLHPHSPPMASVYHLCYYSHGFGKQDFVTVKIDQNSWESFSNSMGFGHFSTCCCSWLHNRANTSTWWIKSHPKR